MKPAINLGLYGFACGVCGGTLSPQASASDEEYLDPETGKRFAFRQYRRFLNCHNEGCPQAVRPVPFPKL